MAYLGQVDRKASNVQVFNVDSSTSATHNIGWTPPSEQTLIVTINGVKQHTNAYSFSGAVLTLSSALVTTDELEVIGINDIGNSLTPVDGSVTASKLGADSVITAKILDDNVTLAKMAGLARGKIIVGDASGDPSALALGASTQVLTSDGSDAAWAAAGSGNTVFISKQTASDDASLAFTSGFSTDYFEYIFKFDNLKPATDTVDILMYLSNDAGSSYYTANMYSVSWYTSRTAGGAVSSDILAKESWNNAFAYMSWNQGNDAGGEWRSAGELRLYRASVALETVWTSTQVQFEADNKLSRQFTGGIGDAAEVVNGIKFEFSSGNITSGDIYMYGVKAE